MTKLIIAAVGIIFAGSMFFAYTKPAYANVGLLKAQIAQYNEAAWGKLTQFFLAGGKAPVPAAAPTTP